MNLTGPKKTKTITRIGVLAAVASVLYFIPGIPIVPPIYKLDFSSLPVILGGFSLGIVPSLIILATKDVIGLFHSSSLGVGELADFVTSACMVIAAVSVYKRNRTLKGALVALAAGTVSMVISGALVNWLVMIPFYVSVMHLPMESIIGMVGKLIPFVDTLPKLILFATVPFNLLKGVVLSVLCFLLYKRISAFLKV